MPLILLIFKAIMSNKVALLPSVLLALSACSFQSAFKEEELFIQSNMTDSDNIVERQVEAGSLSLNYGINLKNNSDLLEDTDGNGANGTNKMAVFIHGTPGNWQSFASFMLFDRLAEQAIVLAIDRPGWGKSLLKTDNKMGIESDFSMQSQYIGTALNRLKKQYQVSTLVLVGHSLGVPISVQVAVDYPQLVDGLLLLAGNLDPQIEGPRWYNKLTNTWLGNYVVPASLRRSNIEMMAKQGEISQLAEKYSLLKGPVTLVHGNVDALVYPANADFAEQTFNRETTKVVRIPKQGHLLHIQQKELIVEELLLLLKQL